MSQSQVERSVITVGIILSVAGAWCVVDGLWEWHRARHFHANARQATATVVWNNTLREALRFQTEQGTVEVPVTQRGFHSPLGATLTILYEPGDPRRWRLPAGDDPLAGAGLAAGGVALFCGGAVMLTLGWISRRRRDRPFWQ
jgi:hypothetical protein